MASFRLDERFDRVLIPYNGLLCLLEDRDVAGCFAAVRDHLAPEGRLHFDVYRPVPEEAPEEEWLPLAVVWQDARRLEVFERCVRRGDGPVVEGLYLYRSREEGEVREVVHGIPQRPRSLEELEGLLAAAGLRVADLAGDLRGAEPCPTSPSIVVTAVLAGGG